MEDLELAKHKQEMAASMAAWRAPVTLNGKMKMLYAKLDWLQGMKPRQIAFKYGVSLNTVRSWHYRHGWSHAKRCLSARVWLAMNYPELSKSEQKELAEYSAGEVHQKRKPAAKKEKLIPAREILSCRV